MNVEIIKTLKLTKGDKTYTLNVGDVITVKTKKGIFDLVQLTAINEKSISVGSYTNPHANPLYIKFKDIEELSDIYNEHEPVEDVVEKNKKEYPDLSEAFGQWNGEEDEE